jgi:hypothetical protein
MPDSYETANGLNPGNAADAELDRDGDGSSNRAEYLAGTSPNEARSAFRVSGVARGTDGISVRIATLPGRLYHLQRRADLAAGTWTTIRSNILATANETVLVDSDAGSLQRAFYRVVLVP